VTSLVRTAPLVMSASLLTAPLLRTMISILPSSTMHNPFAWPGGHDIAFTTSGRLLASSEPSGLVLPSA
jgi:hypothetical protein